MSGAAVFIEHVDAKGRPTGEDFHARGRRAVDVAAGVTRSWGRSLVSSEPYVKNIAPLAGRRIEKTVNLVIHRPPADEVKSIFELTSGALIAPDRQYDNPTPLPRRTPRIRDLLFPASTASSRVEFLTQTGRTNAAAPVIEGAPAPESQISYGIGATPIGTIATYISVSRQLFDDSDEVVAAVDGELAYALQYIEDRELLYGPGTTGFVSGMVAPATPFAAPYAIPGATNIDVIGQALAQAATTEVVPDGVVVNGLDWLRMQTTKDGQGNYILGPPGMGGPPMLFKTPVVPTMAMAAGTFLVGAFQTVTFYEREEIEIAISTQDADDFQKNMVKLRASERAALAVRRPQALITGSLPN